MVMTAMYGINKVGLRERPSYDQLIGYLQGGQEKSDIRIDLQNV